MSSNALDGQEMQMQLKYCEKSLKTTNAMTIQKLQCSKTRAAPH